MKELSYNTISFVLESWEILKRVSKYDEAFGVSMFQRLFIENPSTKKIFGFLEEGAVDAEDKEFIFHARNMVQNLDMALDLLGPDTELLTASMQELGRKHWRYGVRPDMFPAMKIALVQTLEEFLPKHCFSQAVRDAWGEVYDALAEPMIQAQSKQEGSM